MILRGYQLGGLNFACQEGLEDALSPLHIESLIPNLFAPNALGVCARKINHDISAVFGRPERKRAMFRGPLQARKDVLCLVFRTHEKDLAFDAVKDAMVAPWHW